MITVMPAVFYNGTNLKEVIDFTGRDPRFWDEFTSWEEFERQVEDDSGIITMTLPNGSERRFPPNSWIIRMTDGCYACALPGVLAPLGPMFKKKRI